mmetsp:Transcript_98879/g.265543  ORF Transcript_98879/g.265543 Transcript_98879/m.265543 type:complete len:232 (-) Transcript_98879:38-733(-)
MCHLEDLVGHRRGDEDHLGGRREVTVDVVDLLLEAAVQHLIGLIKDQHLDRPGAEVTLLDHVENTPRGAGHDVNAGLEGVDVVRDTLAADAAVHLDVQVITECEADLLRLLGKLACGRQDEHLRLPCAGFHCLQGAQREDAGLTGAALGLHDDVAALQDGQDSPLLHRRGSLEAIGIDAAEQVLLKAKGVERRQHLHVFGRLEDEPLVVRRLVLSSHLPCEAALREPVAAR